MNNQTSGQPGSPDPREESEISHAPVFPEGSVHPDSPARKVQSGAEVHDETARGAQGRYGVSEEPKENSEPVPHVPKSADQLARDRERDEAVRETGEDIGARDGAPPVQEDASQGGEFLDDGVAKTKPSP